MLSLERCATILKEGNIKLENEVLKELKDFLYSLAELQVEAEKNNGIKEVSDVQRNTILQS